MVTLSRDQQISLLNLYDTEICRRLEPLFGSDDVVTSARGLYELLEGEAAIENLRESCESSSEFAEKLWKSLKSSPMKNALYVVVLNYLQEVDKELHDILAMSSENDRRSRFPLVLQHLNGFLKHLQITPCMNYLNEIKQFETAMKTLNKCREEVKDDEHMKRLILRSFPLIGKDSVFDVMRTIHGLNDEATAFVESLHPNFLRYHEFICHERERPRATIRYYPVDMPLENFTNKSLNPGMEMDLTWDDFPDAMSVGMRVLAAINNGLHKEYPVVLREYQKELCEGAVQGRNTIICAPTGSGKTVVAAHIVKQHLIKRLMTGSNGNRGKVLFMICNVTLLEQQAKTFTRYLDHRFEVGKSCGSDDFPLYDLIACKDVVVCTPQMIVNLLERTQDDENGGVCRRKFCLDMFTMIIFDECHNAKKSSPYSVLMRHYHRTKFTGQSRNLPQVVGLTASLGVGSAKDVKEALEHMSKLCATLYCTEIGVVRRNLRELLSFSPATPDQVEEVYDSAHSTREEFVVAACNAMEELEKLLQNVFLAHHVQVQPARSSSPTDSPERYTNNTSAISMPPNNKRSFDYLNWVANHRSKIVPEAIISDAVKRDAMEIFQLLYIFYRGLELAEDFTTNDALDHFLSEFEQISLSPIASGIIKRSMSKLRTFSTSQCSLVDAVVRFLIVQHEDNPDFRSIVFVRTRQGASILSKLLNGNKTLQRVKIFAESITGVNAPSGSADEKSSRKEQADRLERFARGDTKVLVSTAVAEEGLDIAKCNLVIKYNYATNEIAHVQRRGRGRAENSKCILVTNKHALKEQEEKNIAKENLMTSALDVITASKFDLKRHVMEKIKELQQTIIREDAQKEDRILRQNNSGNIYELLCRNCSTFLCRHSSVKKSGSQYVVCDPDFWSKVKTKECTQEETRASKFGERATIFCANPKCTGILLGRVVHIQNNDLPVIAANAFTLSFQLHGLQERRVVKKWKAVEEHYFTPSEMRSFDLMGMKNAPNAPKFSEVSGIVQL